MSTIVPEPEVPAPPVPSVKATALGQLIRTSHPSISDTLSVASDLVKLLSLVYGKNKVLSGGFGLNSIGRTDDGQWFVDEKFIADPDVEHKDKDKGGDDTVSEKIICRYLLGIIACLHLKAVCHPLAAAQVCMSIAEGSRTPVVRLICHCSEKELLLSEIGLVICGMLLSGK